MKFAKTTLFVIGLFFALTCYSQAPANDNCANAVNIPISGSGYNYGTFTTANYDMTHATIEAGENFYSTLSSAGQNKKSVWFKFTLPTARKCKLTVDQPAHAIASGDVGFTVYKTSSCFPTSVQADSALLAAQTVFGYSTNPCMKPDTYYVQVSSNYNANGPILVTLQVDTPAPASYDYPAFAYDFGVLNCTGYVDHHIGCQTVNDATEVCTGLGADWSQSTWYTFTTGSYLDLVSVLISPTNEQYFFNNSQAIIGYNLYQGDAKVTSIGTLTLIDGCLNDTIQNYGNPIYSYSFFHRNYKCTLLPNTTYSIQVFHHKDFDDDIRVRVNQLGASSSQGVKPLTTNITGTNAMGAIPAGTTTVSDYFGCNSRMSLNNCGTQNPDTGVTTYSNYTGITHYNLADWFTFTLTQSASVNIVVSNGGVTPHCRLYAKGVNGSCTNITNADMVDQWDNSITFHCMAAGSYSLQVLGYDSIFSNWYPNCSAYAGMLGQQTVVYITQTPLRYLNQYSLNTVGAVDTINGVGTFIKQLKADSIFYSQTDTFGCGNTVLPADSNLCTYSSTPTKAIYQEFNIQDGNGDGTLDSGVVYMNFTNSWNYWTSIYKLYQGNASTLTTTQNKHTYPQTFTGLTPASTCISNQAWYLPPPHACVVPGVYTLATYGDSTLIGQSSNNNVTYHIISRKHYTSAKAQDMGSILDSATTYSTTTLSTDVDTFSCYDNPATIGGFTPCNGSNGLPMTKLIYRQFYLSQPSYLTITSTSNYYGSWAGNYTLFAGKATSGIASLSRVDPIWECVTTASSPACNPLPAGWYTLVSYADGPNYSTNLSSYNGTWGGEGGAVGMPNQLSITINPVPPGPQYDYPYKACIDTSAHQPFLLSLGNRGTAAYPITDSTYTLPTEHYNCITDTPFSAHPVVACDGGNSSNYNRATYYVFKITQESFVDIYNIGGNGWNAMAKVYPFDVRIDSAKMMTDSAVQPCLNNADQISLCRLQPGTYTLVIFQPNIVTTGYNITPTIYIDKTGYSRFDHTQNAYDFGAVPVDSVWHNGKTGDVNPLNATRAPSNDFFYCTTGAQPTNPDQYSTPTCYAPSYDPLIYVGTINHSLTDNSIYTGGRPLRTLWYTFVLNYGGTCHVRVNSKTINKANQLPFTVYSSDVDGSLPFSTVRATGQVDSTITQGLTEVVNDYYYYCGNSNEVSFYQSPCAGKPIRYYIKVDNSYFLEVNYQCEVEILYDTINNPPVKYDHYYQANPITLTTNNTYRGGQDNFTCATTDSTEPNAQNCNPRSVWYKITVPTEGRMELNYFIDSVLHGYDHNLTLYRQTIAGDSTPAGLQFISLNNLYYPASSSYWGEACVYPGTYYLIMTGCDFVTNYVQPIVNYHITQPKYDYYATANTINVPSDGFYKGGTDNFTCATTNSSDPTYPYYCNPRNLWYKINISQSGYLNLNYYLDSVLHGYDAELVLYRQTTAGDSTAAGMQYIPLTNFFDDNYTASYWGRTCVYEGTYYLIMRGCNLYINDVQPTVWFQSDSGDYCHTAISALISTPGSVSVSTVIDCHTIGGDFGEDGSNMGCLIPSNSTVTAYKSTWFSFVISSTDTFDITATLTNGTNANSGLIRYRLMIGSCNAMNTGSCFVSALTVNTLNCLAQGTYFIQVVEPVFANSSGTPTTGTISVNFNAVKSFPGCVPVQTCFAVANFNTTSPCDKDSTYFQNTSTAGDSIRYHWDFGYHGDTSNLMNPVYQFPSPLDTQFYSVLLTVKNIKCNKIDSTRQDVMITKKPRPIIIPDTSICTTANTFYFDTLTAHGWAGTAYNWDIGSTDSVAISYGDYISTSPTHYTHFVTSTLNGCSRTDSTHITFKPQPVSNLIPPGAPCHQTPVTLSLYNGFSNETYHWSTGDTTSSTTVYNNGMVYGTVTASGCTTTDSVLVIFSIDSSGEHILGNDTVICNDSAINITFDLSYGFNGSIVNWNGPAYDPFSGISTVTDTGTYWVELYLPPCYVHDTIHITRGKAIKPVIKGDSTLCGAGSNAVLQVSPTYAIYQWSNGSNKDTANIHATGQYAITVTNTQGCQASDTIQVTATSSMLLTTVDTMVKCFGQSNGAIKLTVTGGKPTYTYKWENNSTLPNRSALPAGIYSVSVTDSGGCTLSKTDTITQPTKLTTTTIATPDSCFGDSKGKITATPTGGTTPYAYAWSGGGSTAIKANLPTGIYTITITDKNGCTATAFDTVKQPAKLNLTKVDTQVSCFGTATAKIHLNPSGGTSPYTYSWSNASNAQNLINVAVGIYTVTVNDNRNCSANLSDTITEPTAIVPSFAITNVSCVGGNTGAIKLTVTGGKTPYSYHWENGATSPNRTGLSVGTYTVTITDSNGCTAIKSAHIDSGVLNITHTDTAVTCYGGGDGKSKVTVTGGNAPYHLSWTDGSTAFYRNDLIGVTYYLFVVDSSGCSTLDSVIMTQPQMIKINPLDSNPRCFGNTNGSITTSVTGGTSPYTYNWGGGITSPSRTNLAAGNYQVTVTDAHSCTVVYKDTLVAPPAFSYVLTDTQVKCFNTPTASISMTAIGGTTPLTYTWSNGVTGGYNPALIAGIYTVTVKDKNNCSTIAHDTITQPTALVPTFVVKNVSCGGGNDGAINLTVTGGKSPYTYHWENGDASQNRSDLIVGTYTVTVTDSNGCTAIKSTNLNSGNLTLTHTDSAVHCFGDSNGSATLNHTGGTAPYHILWNDGDTNVIRANLKVTTYFITLTDSNHCTATDTVTITQPVALQVSSIDTAPLCFGNTNGSITTSVTGGTSPYTYNWGGGITSPSRTNLAAGNYQVTVTDAHSCTVVYKDTLVAPPAFSYVLTDTQVKCFNTPTASISMTAIGGTTPLTYTWSNGVTGGYNPALIAGIYTVTVKDKNNCSTIVKDTISQPTTLLPSFVVTNVSCGGGNDGAINLAVTGGKSPYTYHWENGDTSQNRSDLIVGTYTVTVTDFNGCTAIKSTNLNSGNLTLTHTDSAVHCFGDSNGSATLNHTGGTAPYHILWNDGDTNVIRANLKVTTYFITLTDSNHCTATDTVTITQPVALQVSSIDTAPLCFGNTNGKITTTVTGGTSPYSYNWGGGINTANRSNISAGNYQVTVTDAHSCTVVYKDTLISPPAFSYILTDTQVKCFNTPTASISMTAIGGTTPLTYTWSNGVTGGYNPALIAGIYTVTVKDKNNCSTIAHDTITQPTALQISFSVTNVGCTGGNTGSIHTTTTGGTSVYTYHWNTGATTDSITNLSVGPYLVTVTDTNQCIKIDSTQIHLSTSPSLTHTDTAVSCFGLADGRAKLSVTGGSTPYHYTWNDGDTSQSRHILTAGVYHITLTDGGGCTATDTITISQPAVLQVSANDTAPLCFGNTNGKIGTTVTGGTNPYTYNWGGGITSSNRTNLAAGIYQVTVTDAHSCNAIHADTLLAPTPIVILDTLQNVSCPNGADGAIHIGVSGGSAPYTYHWNNNATTANITSLTAGIYILTLTDSNHCTKPDTVHLTAPTTISTIDTITSITCHNANDGAIVIHASGGNGGYTYTWSNSITDSVNLTLSPATYYVTTTDAKLCSRVDSFTMINPTAIQVLLTPTNPRCATTIDGVIRAIVSGGTPIYHYHWNDGDTLAKDSLLAPGLYIVTVTDGHGCSRIDSATLTAPAVLSAISHDTNVTCYGLANGKTQIVATGGVSPYTYSWSGIGTGAFSTILPTGVYTVTVTDSNFCTTTVSIHISQPDSFHLSAVVDSVHCYGGSDGAITQTVSGATAPYHYSWSNSDTMLSLTTKPIGTYTVTITDSASCTATRSYTIYQPDSIHLKLTPDSVKCWGGATGSITTTLTGGSTPFTYDWSDGSHNNTLPAKSIGTYTLTLTDGRGCKRVDSAAIYQPDSISLTISPTNLKCFGDNSGAVTLTVQGGTSAYSYSWSNGSNSSSLTGVAANNYTVTVTDSKLCTKSINTTVTQPTALSIIHHTTPATCSYSSDGGITDTVSGGKQPYSYHWSNSGATPTLNNLAMGIYILTVTDSSLCTVTTTDTINGPTPIQTLLSVTNISCYGAADGRIVASTTGGNSPYTYQWSSGGSVSNTDSLLTLGNYTVTITDAKSCTATFTTTLSQPDSLYLTATITDEACLNANNGAIQIVVSGGTPAYTYAWADGVTTAIRTNLSHGLYSITVTDAHLCTVAISDSVVINQDMQLAAVVSQPPCPQVNLGAINLTTKGSSGPYTYHWNDNNTQTNRSKLTAGDYQLTVTDKYGCTIDTSFKLSYQYTLSVQANPHFDSLQLGESIQVNTTTTPTHILYQWTPVTGLSCSDCANPIAAPFHDIIYVVKGYDTVGCYAYDTISLTVISNYNLYIPNAFTPNADQHNDYFEIFGNKSAMRSLSISIFNGWGERVFESNDIDFKWDGTFEGSLLAPGVFAYTLKITFVDGYILEGHNHGSVTLIR